MVDVRELKENHPEFALLLETRGAEPVQFSNLSYTKVPVHDLEVGSHILVRAGEVCHIMYRNVVLAFLVFFSFHSFVMDFFNYFLAGHSELSIIFFFFFLYVGVILLLVASKFYLNLVQFLCSLGCAC
jgi:hypothetical protein